MDKYGIVIDAGSSGSRLQIYKWKDPAAILADGSASASILHSVPHIIQEKKWSSRVNPGLSSYANKPGNIWKNHLRPLIEFAETIIPKDSIKDTPIFVQATAGMRLLPEKKRNKVLDTVCDSLRRYSKFKIDSCSDQIEVIDGETEGIYGWMALNYLKNEFNDFDKSKALDSRSTFGFMDMGGASTQIAFVPSKQSEREKHSDELYTVRIRGIDGTVQEWPVFVSTWLGFGANEAHRRHLRNLIMALPEGVNYDINGDDTYDITDPCSQKGMKVQQEYKGITYDITGSGDYRQCIRTIYPLLLKHLPCKDNSCLFNGVSAPKIEFDTDRFVGVSEYWYTANDVFHMAGDYNFKQYEQRLKSFCEADWSTVERNYNDGKYGENINLPLLKDSCFKASWIVNVLHEGFGLPRIGVDEDTGADSDSDDTAAGKSSESAFQSANSINGADLSWTLGKILLYASSSVPVSMYAAPVGLFPSAAKQLELSQQKDEAYSQRDRESLFGWWIFFFFVFSIMAIVFVLRGGHPKTKSQLLKVFLKFQGTVNRLKSRAAGAYVRLSGGNSDEVDITEQSEELSNLEAGRFVHPSESSADLGAATLRTRSTANLQDLRESTISPISASPSPPLPPSWTNDKPGIPHSQSFSSFPLRTGNTSYDLNGKRYPSRYPNQTGKPSINNSSPDFMSMIKNGQEK
ncbi:DEKNAAC104186 [Brettanomyces naardenensis]|uniref:DEKNAAC104186 n=1 Tax=Brettanomyces naardenensis TaxID=13370 RepID=A0A448YQ32_BRENA|nr:DEKNAAC104186 [Brettanomyces naardenensis]